jgi:hypothetical protein
MITFLKICTSGYNIGKIPSPNFAFQAYIFDVLDQKYESTTNTDIFDRNDSFEYKWNKF